MDQFAKKVDEAVSSYNRFVEENDIRRNKAAFPGLHKHLEFELKKRYLSVNADICKDQDLKQRIA